MIILLTVFLVLYIIPLWLLSALYLEPSVTNPNWLNPRDEVLRQGIQLYSNSPMTEEMADSVSK